jgi:hypothetical protein
MKLLNRNLDIQLSPATVLRVNNNAKPGTLSYSLSPALLKAQTDILFQLKDSEKMLPLSVYNMQLPLYDKQEVDIISANQFIIGFVDIKSEEYYYVTKDFCEAMGSKFFDMLSWFAGIVAIMIILTSAKSVYTPVYVITTLILTWLGNIIAKEVFNRKIENAIDERMQAFSLF